MAESGSGELELFNKLLPEEIFVAQHDCVVMILFP